MLVVIPAMTVISRDRDDDYRQAGIDPLRLTRPLRARVGIVADRLLLFGIDGDDRLPVGLERAHQVSAWSRPVALDRPRTYLHMISTRSGREFHLRVVGCDGRRRARPCYRSQQETRLAGEAQGERADG